MAFGIEGTVPVTITDARIADCRLKAAANFPNSFDIALLCQAEDGQSDWWHGECSHRLGSGKAANKTQMQMTQETLAKIGLQDISQFASLIGTKTVVVTERSQCGRYVNIKYLGGGSYNVEALEQSEAQRRMQALLSAPAPQEQSYQFQQPQAPQAPQAPNQQQQQQQQQFQYQQPQSGQTGHAN